MTLEQYTAVDDTDTFCYCVEHGTHDLGSISGYPSNKFGIFKRKPGSPVPVSSDFEYDEEYTWRRKYGNDRHEAFARVKELVIAVVEAAQANEMDAVGSIDLVKLYKWKLAYLYAPDQVVPIFKRTMLELVARELGLSNTRNASYAQLHRYILEQMPAGTDPTLYAREAYRRLEDQAPRYYVIGSTYDGESIFPQMHERNVVAIGFMESVDLRELEDASDGELDAFISKYHADRNMGDRGAIMAVPHFMDLKAGDRIAVKKHSDRKQTTIMAYAVVVERDGAVYLHDPNGLGQVVHVEFLDAYVERRVPHVYPHTLHEVKLGSDKWKALFETVDAMLEVPGPSPSLEGTTDRKNTEDYERSGSPAVRVARNHNRIQQALFDKLFTEHGNKARMEVGGQVDIILDEGQDLTLYEVKPYPTAHSCIRAALGQLIDYAFQYGQGRSLKLRVVGPAELTPEERPFLEHVRATISVEFDYIAHPQA